MAEQVSVQVTDVVIESNTPPAVVVWFLEKLGKPIGYEGPKIKAIDIMNAIQTVPEEFGNEGQFKRRKF